MSRSSSHRAQRRAPFASFARKPWIIAYSIAVVGTAIVGISTAPSAPTTAPALTDLLSEEKAASFALAAEKGGRAAPRRDFMVASVTFSPVGQKFGHNWYERIAEPGAENAALRSGGFKAAETAPAKPASIERATKKAPRVAKALEVPLPEGQIGRAHV